MILLLKGNKMLRLEICLLLFFSAGSITAFAEGVEPVDCGEDTPMVFSLEAEPESIDLSEFRPDDGINYSTINPRGNRNIQVDLCVDISD